MPTVFELIIRGEIPSTKLYEDDTIIAILDINPVHKGHALIIAKHPYPTFTDCPISTLSHMMEIAQRIDLKQREVLHSDGSNILINNGKAAGQEVPHLHIHVIPRFTDDGQRFGFSKTSYTGNELKEMGDALAL